ncbi:MAG: helix-turn-helix transcriptional regulator [Actinomycetota bacterium]
MSVRRIERLINLIAALLETERPLTAEQIRDRIAGYDQPNQEAFRRAFERDKDALRTMGIPLELRPTGVMGQDVEGYIIPKEKYYLPELDLEPDELAALKLAAETVVGGSSVAESGLMKLSVDAPGTSWSGPRVVWGADVAAEQPLLGPLYEALLDRAPVTFEYETATGDASERTVEPYGLVHRSGHWYVVGRDSVRDAVRSFKVSRIKPDVSKGSATFDIPESFDARAHLAGEPWEIGEQTATQAEVRFDPALAWWPEQNLAGLEQTTVSDGAVHVQMPVANVDAFVSWVIGFADQVEVVEPAEVREAVARQIERFVRA